jgi:hypothetical protein
MMAAEAQLVKEQDDNLGLKFKTFSLRKTLLREF